VPDGSFDDQVGPPETQQGQVAPQARSSSTARLVGRDADLSIVRSFAGRTAAQGGSLVVVGEPGVGKTALLNEAAAESESAGARILRATGVEFEADVSYAGLNELLWAETASLQVLDRDQAVALETALGRRVSTPPDRLVVAEAVRSLLRQAAQVRPLLLVVDDLQWLDRASAAVLGLVARRLAGSRVGLLGALRPAAGFFERSRLDEHQLAPLTDEQSAKLLDTRFPGLAPHVRRHVLAVAQGNPLALLELPGVLAEGGRDKPPWPSAVLPLSRRLQLTFASRFAGLPRDARDALLLAALEGSGELHTLNAAARGTFLAGLAPAERSGFVKVDDLRLHIEFSHPLTRSAIVAQSTAAERRRAHRRLAAASEDPDRRAWHIAHAAAGPDETAAGSLEQAAYRILQRGDAVGAVAAFTRSAFLSPDRSSRARRLADAAYAGAQLWGGLAAADGVLREAARTDPQGFGSLDASVATAFVILNADGDVGTAHRMLAGALDGVPAGSALTFQVRAALSTLMYICLFGSQAEPWAAFDAVTRRLGDQVPAPIAVCRQTCGDPARASSRAVADLDALLAGIDREEDPAAVIAIAVAGFFLDRMTRSRAALERVVGQARESGEVYLVMQAQPVLGFEAFFRGRWDEAERHFSATLSLVRQHGYRLYEWISGYGLAVVAAARGDADAARERVAEYLRWAVPRGVHVVRHLCGHALALAALGRQDYEQAYQEAAAVSPPGVAPAYCPPALWMFLDLVEAAVKTGRREEAVAHVVMARAIGLGGLSGRLGFLLRAAEALVAEGAAAQEHFRSALSVPGAAQWPFDYARVELLYGEHLRRVRDPGAARRHLEGALAIFERLGAATWAARAHEELRAAAGRTRSPARAAGLTTRELLIAELAASGLTNKEIGERLFLSSRTVSDHLYHVFPKLGITSRAGLRDALAGPGGDPGAGSPLKLAALLGVQLGEGEGLVGTAPAAVDDLVDKDHRVGAHVLSEIVRENGGHLVDDLFLLLRVERALRHFDIRERHRGAPVFPVSYVMLGGESVKGCCGWSAGSPGRCGGRNPP
jgi:DNA-binding CsgD family transcriptional regulator